MRVGLDITIVLFTPNIVMGGSLSSLWLPGFPGEHLRSQHVSYIVRRKTNMVDEMTQECGRIVGEENLSVSTRSFETERAFIPYSTPFHLYGQFHNTCRRLG